MIIAWFQEEPAQVAWYTLVSGSCCVLPGYSATQKMSGSFSHWWCKVSLVVWNYVDRNLSIARARKLFSLYTNSWKWSGTRKKNPIVQIWALVKDFIVVRNISFNFNLWWHRTSKRDLTVQLGTFTNNLLFEVVMWSTFRSIKFRFTVQHRPPFTYQVEVLCFDCNAIWLLWRKVYREQTQSGQELVNFSSLIFS
jgi:hypothetical protein